MNRPIPSSKNPHFQKEAKCTTFLVKMSFICMRMKNHFHIEGWALHLALLQRPGGTPKTYCICTIFESISNQQVLSRFETEAWDNSKMACSSWLCVKKQRKRKLDKEASKQVRQKHMVTGASFLEWYLWQGEGKPKLEPRPDWYPLELISNISPTPHPPPPPRPPPSGVIYTHKNLFCTGGFINLFDSVFVVPN